METPPESEKNLYGIRQEWASTLDAHALTRFLESIIINKKTLDDLFGYQQECGHMEPGCRGDHRLFRG